MEIDYGIPEQDAHLQLLHDQITLNQQQLGQAAHIMAKAMYDVLQSNDYQLNKANTAIKRAVRGRIAGNNYHLKEVQDQLSNVLAGQVRANNDLLASAYAHLPAGTIVATKPLPTRPGVPIAGGGGVTHPVGTIPVTPIAGIPPGGFPPADPQICYVYNGPNGFCASNLNPSSTVWNNEPYTFVAGPMSCQQAIAQYGQNGAIYT
jgi:hypothetical protein